MNSKRSVALLLYTNDKWAENRETIPFTVATSNLKHFGVTLPKQVKDLYDNDF